MTSILFPLGRTSPTCVASAAGLILLAITVAPRAVAQQTVTTYKPASSYEELRAEADLLDRQNHLLRDIVRLTRPSVAHIHAAKVADNENGVLTDVAEAGAGVIYQRGDQTFVITNRHVIAGAELKHIRIQLENGRFFSPTEVRSDPEFDLAVLYLAETDLMPAQFGDSDAAEIGDFVVAVGSPFGLNHSVSYGIISALGRRDLDLGSEGVRYQNFMQTDAAINPGNSGGPLINLHGEVIGINTAIASNTGGNDGIGFTIPSNTVLHIVDQLIDHGRARRGFLGVVLDSKYSPEAASALGLNTAYGARITRITAESPAAASDLRVGDVILTYDDMPVVNDSHLVSLVSLTEIGSEVPLVVYRDGARITVTVVIQERTDAQ
jgi:serine protease Do